MKRLILLFSSTLLLLTSCVNNQKDKLAYSSDSTEVTEAPQGVNDEIKPVNLNEDEIIKAGFKSQKGLPTIVDFSAVWCGPCQQFKPIFKEAQKEYAGKVDFITVDVDSFPKLSEKYRISAVPTIIYFDAAGKELNRTQGFIGKEPFNVAINELLEK